VAIRPRPHRVAARAPVAGFLALLVAAAFAPLPARACSVCLAGDPLFSTNGTTSQESGSFTIYLEARTFSKSSRFGATDGTDAVQTETQRAQSNGGGTAAGASARKAGARAALRPRHAGHPHQPIPRPEEGDEDPEPVVLPTGSERSRGERVDLYASWTPLDRFTLTLDVPFAWNRIVDKVAGDRTRSTLSGFGDVSLGTSFVLWRNRDVLPATWVEGRLWLKAPTGRDESKVEGVRDPHLQPGTGSWDFGAGLAAVHRLDWGSLYGSVFYRENTPGSLGYTYGDVWLANLAFEVPIGHALEQPWLTWLTAGMELNFRYAGYDHQDGDRYVESGGSIVYATPSVRVRLPWTIAGQPLSLRGAVQIPLTQKWLHGKQHENEVYSLGVLLPF
jgi:hypothetical protein